MFTVTHGFSGMVKWIGTLCHSRSNFDSISWEAVPNSLTFLLAIERQVGRFAWSPLGGDMNHNFQKSKSK